MLPTELPLCNSSLKDISEIHTKIIIIADAYARSINARSIYARQAAGLPIPWGKQVCFYDLKYQHFQRIMYIHIQPSSYQETAGLWWKIKLS